MSHNVIRALYEDELGRLWVGTGGAGLARLDPQTDKFHIYRGGDAVTSRNGLPNGTIYAIVPDYQGHWWLSTNNGLVKFSPATQEFKTYTQGDGLPSNEFDFGAYYRAPDGELFFGGVDGFTAFYPENISDAWHAPAIVLTALTQGGEPMALQEAVAHVPSVALHWPENFFEFAFTALSYSRPEKNQYAYMLQGLDKDWNYVGTQRFGRYTNLSGGTYTLRVKGANSAGVWNETGLAVEITVVPPIWGTWWFRALVLCVSAGLILVGYRLRVKNIKARARSLEIEVARRSAELQRESQQRMRVEAKLREREMAEAVAAERSRLARELHDAVTQTLFSASLIAEALPVLWKLDRGEGERRLQELRLLSRGALAEMRALLMELRPSALVETGLEELLHQLGEAVTGRSGLQIAVTVHGRCDVPDDVHITLYRIAQEALNNAVKHARATEVAVTLDCIAGDACETSSGVELRVSDNGRGFDPHQRSPQGLGLGIMQERVQAIGASLRILSVPEQGTQVIACWETRVD